MDNLQALAIVLKLDKVLLIMSKLSTDLRNICNLNSAINILLYQLYQPANCQARSQTRAHPGSARVAQNIARVAQSIRLPG